MPLTRHTNTPGGPRRHLPHLLLIAGLAVVLVAATVIGGQG